MRKAKQSESSRMMRPALTPEARENQLVSLAVDLAEKQLREGTASSQVITHYLKLGSTKERIEKEILEKQKELIEAKTQNLKSIENSEKLYADALKAFRGYSGHGDEVVGEETFGFDRYLNQIFYNSQEWKDIRRKIIIRDNGCDLGLDGYEIRGKILIHHMNPIRQQDILLRTDLVLNPEYLIATTLSTHNAIHYGDEKLLLTVPNERRKNDTCPWRH